MVVVVYGELATAPAEIVLVATKTMTSTTRTIIMKVTMVVEATNAIGTVVKVLFSAFCQLLLPTQQKLPFFDMYCTI